MIYIFIIEDHPIVIDGLIKWFKDPHCGIKITGITDCVDETIVHKIPESVDVIILDLYLADAVIDPINNIKSLKQDFPQKKIIIYTGDRTDFWVEAAFKNGVSAYLYKGTMHEHLFKEIIHRVATGEIIKPTNQLTSEKIHFKTTLLSSTDKNILTIVSEGKTNRQAAIELNMSKTAIDKRLSRLRKKNQVTNNVQLIVQLLNKHGV